MANIIIVGTPRYSINMVDIDLAFRYSDHNIVKVLYHHHNTRERWFYSGKYDDAKRNRICTKLLDHPSEQWDNTSHLYSLLENEKYDYIAMGNGNDWVGKALKNKFSDKKFIFTEYGFMPWYQCFYLDLKGVGRESSIFDIKLEDIKQYNYDSEQISLIKNNMMDGKKIKMSNFIYVPLQVDVPDGEGNPDFKFRFTKFKNNVEFLNYIKNIIPKSIRIVVKNHPLSPKKTKIPEGMIDITNMNISKYSIYKNMKAMIGINSTSMIEGIMFNKPVFSYGEDIFSNKGITYANVESGDILLDCLDRDINIELNNKFISIILERQFIRHKFKDEKYVKNHYWNRNLV